MHTVGVPAANVAFKVAYAVVLEATVKSAETCHPRDMLDEQLKVSSVVLSLGGATTVTEPPVTLGVVAGFFLPSARASDALPGWISEAVSFQHTTKDAVVRAGTVGATMTIAQEKKLQLAQQTFVADVPSNFSGNAINNSLALYAMYKAPRLRNSHNYSLPLAHSQIAQKWSDRSRREVIRPCPQLLPYVTKDGDKTYLPMPVQCIQNNLVVTTSQFYAALRDHRDVRGSDAKHVSALTSGYYIGTMSRALDRVIWQATDIISTARLLKATTIIFERSDINTNVIATLVANGLKVIVLTTKNIVSSLFTTMDFLTAKLPPASIHYASGYFTQSAPTVTKKGIVGQTAEEFQTMFKNFTFEHPGVYRMTHLYLMDYHSEYIKYMLPSIHCHAGHVILCSVPIVTEPKTIVQHFARMTLSNKYKTAFAVRRAPFGVLDTSCPQVLREGLRLASCVVARKSEDLNYTNYEIAEVFKMRTFEAEPVEFHSSVVHEVQHVDPKIDPSLVFAEQLATGDVVDLSQVDDIPAEMPPLEGDPDDIQYSDVIF